jgi:hypothetical protein
MSKTLIEKYLKITYKLKKDTNVANWQTNSMQALHKFNTYVKSQHYHCNVGSRQKRTSL